MNQKINIEDIQSIEDVERLAAESGIRLRASDYNAAEVARSKAQERARNRAGGEAESDSGGIVATFNRHYPRLLDAIAGAGNVIITLSQAFIVNLGAPVVLVLLLIVEQQRVFHGLELFEASPALAAFGAWALVLTNLALEIIAHHIEHTKGYERDRAKKSSLRLHWKNFRYWLGLGGDSWKAQEKSPADTERRLLGIVTFTILALALAGSMKPVIETQSGAWYAAMWAILTESNLLNMFTWLGGLLFAFAAVMSAQGLSRYIAIRTVEIRAQMTGDTAEDRQTSEAAAARALYARIADKLAESHQQPPSRPESAQNGATPVNPTQSAAKPGSHPAAALQQPPGNVAQNGNGKH